jgi:2-polyprenyl-3-methyl-5-hydroxy-6-metoxy-1,4-benzoquinol methylase
VSDSQRDRYRLSFGSVAEAYERARPLYAVEALEWLQKRLPLRRVVDVGAGTGKLSRQLAAIGMQGRGLTTVQLEVMRN